MVWNHSTRTFASPKTRWKCGSSALRSSSVSLTSKTRTRFTSPQRRGWDSNPRSFRSQTFQVCALSRTRRPLLYMDYPAERVGFEPTRLSPTAFRERHLQPLGHHPTPKCKEVSGDVRP